MGGPGSSPIYPEQLLDSVFIPGIAEQAVC